MVCYYDCLVLMIVCVFDTPNQLRSPGKILKVYLIVMV